MDGLENTGSGSKTFVNTFKGKFTVKSNEEDPFAVRRVNKMNAIVFEKHFDTLTGFLIGIVKHLPDPEKYSYDPNWNLTLLTEQGVEYVLSLPYSGRVTMGVFGRFPNVDAGKKMRLRIFYFEQEDKSAIVLQQKNAEDKWADVGKYWTKEDPKHLPQLEKKVINNKDIWDATAQMHYIERYLNEKFAPVLDANVPMIIEAYKNAPPPEAARNAEDKDIPDDSDIHVNPPATNLPEETDDLPF